MRKTLRIAALTASLATVLSGGLMAAAGSAGAASASAGPGAHVINLHQAYKANLGHVKTGKIGGIMHPRGHKLKSQQAGNACSEPNCNLVYNGGPVQHSPKVWLLLWGPDWSTDSSQAATAIQMESFLGGLGQQPQDSWSTSMSQYGDGSGFPTFNSSVYQGFWQDTSTPPTGVDQGGLTAEADAFAAQQGLNSEDDQIVVATQSGTCPDGFYAPGCSGGSGYYCAWHTNGNVPFTNMPYVLDSGGGCGQDFVNANGTYDGVSIVEGHEYAETVTDPSVEFGWWDPNDFVSGGENGDKCAWDPMSNNVALATGSFAMQPLWSNDQSGCVMSEAPGSHFAVNPVAGLKAAPRFTQADLKWTSSQDATSYRIRIRNTANTLIFQVTIKGTSYTLHNLKALHTYKAAVRANPAAPGAALASVSFKTK